MEEITDEQLLALASCPPGPAARDEMPPVDQVEERTELQKVVLHDLLDHIISCVCDNMVAIGTALKKIERHLFRLADKELAGTGRQLASIAAYLKIIAATQIGEHNMMLGQLYPELLDIRYPEEPIPAPRPIDPKTPFELQFDEPAYNLAPPPPPEQFEFIERPPLIGPPAQPEEPEPSFEPETSAAVGGGTFAAPQPTSKLEGDIFGPTEGIVPDLIVLPTELA